MIETKQVELIGSPNGDKYYREQYSKCHKEIEAMIAFGWQPTQVASERFSRSTHNYQIMARDTTMPHYSEYKKYESEYYDAISKFKTYKPMDLSTALLLLLIFVIPGVLYIMYKLNQKAEIKENNDNCRLKMNQAIEKARNIQ